MQQLQLQRGPGFGSTLLFVAFGHIAAVAGALPYACFVSSTVISHFAIGKVTAVKGDKPTDLVSVHEFEPRKGVGTTFLPLWVKGKRRERKADKPTGFAADEVEVAVAKLVCSVELDGNNKLTEASDNYVQTLGFTL